MALYPVPMDANGRRLSDVGSQVFTDRKTLSTGFTDLKFGLDIKGICLYVNSGTLVIRGAARFGVSYCAAAAAVDSGGGLVTISATAHGFSPADTVEVSGTVNYDGVHTLHATTGTDTLVITATYVAENIPATAYAVGYRDAQVPAGASIEIPICVEAMATAAQVKASSGSAVIDIYAWR